MKLGSLFDGSGGFPLAGALVGIEPVWAAEVEPYPIAVTRSRFPKMKHLGSVTEVHGDKIEPVDVITFGSPCQDLSVAGKRAGMKHENEGDDETTRSGLFIEAVRIIKEMRDATNGVYPRFAVWENVPGAFSSNGGQDFRIVLEKLIQIAEPTAIMPDVPKGGWAYADSYRGDGWSIAYRTFDAQYWGVPQRRRRIYLVADFTGGCAGEVLFKSQGLRGYFEEGRAPWQGATQNAERSSATNDSEIPYTLEPGIAQREGGHIYEGVSGTLRANAGDNQMAVAYDADTTAIGFDGYNAAETGEKVATLGVNCGMSTGRNGVVVGFCAYNQAVTGDVAKSLTAKSSDADHIPVVITNKPVYSVENHPADSRVNLDESGKVQTLTSRMGTGGGNVPMVMEVLGLDRASFNQGKNAQYDFSITEDGTEPTLTARGPGAVCYCLQDKSIGRKESNSCHGLGVSEETSYTLTGIDRHAVAYWDGGQTAGTLTANNAGGNQRMPDKENFNAVIESSPHRYIVRRLTPTECARLQGFPDCWGHPDLKEKFTKEEYEFWLDIRNTHAIINGKTTKQYTKEQMLNWYNKLHTDAAEYKMWGNGIALPTALYVLQGIADVKEDKNG